jgi:hypothetical protein
MASRLQRAVDVWKKSFDPNSKAKAVAIQKEIAASGGQINGTIIQIALSKPCGARITTTPWV